MFWSIAAVAMSAAQAFGSVYQGYAMQAAYQAKAAQSQLKFKSMEIAAKQQGVNAIRKVNENMSTLIAEAGSRGTWTTTGSNALLQMVSASSGFEAALTAKNNAKLQSLMGKMDVSALNQMGDDAMMAGFFNAAGELAGTAIEIEKTGAFEDLFAKEEQISSKKQTSSKLITPSGAFDNLTGGGGYKYG
jgi:hypothetical protein